MWSDMTWFNQIISMMQQLVTILVEEPFVYFIQLSLVAAVFKMILSFVKVRR